MAKVPITVRNQVLRSRAGINANNGPVVDIHALFVDRVRVADDEVTVQAEGDSHRPDQILAFREFGWRKSYCSYNFIYAGCSQILLGK